MTTQEQTSFDEKPDQFDDSVWIRPCGIYQEEYEDCISRDGRKHQLYTTGVKKDCSKWKEDAENCEKFVFQDDLEAMAKIVENEKNRQKERLKNAFNNNIWEYRDSPPPDWNKPIPGWEEKSSYFKKPKAAESSCSIL